MAKAPAAKKRLMYLENSALYAMAADSRYAARFPFLASLLGMKTEGTGSGCASCKQNSPRNKAFNRVKQQIINLAAPDLAELKTMLNTQQLTVRWSDGAGKNWAKTV